MAISVSKTVRMENEDLFNESIIQDFLMSSVESKKEEGVCFLFYPASLYIPLHNKLE